MCTGGKFITKFRVLEDSKSQRANVQRKRKKKTDFKNKNLKKETLYLGLKLNGDKFCALVTDSQVEY